MGLFDYVQCNYPLPWPDMAGHEFQSKSLGCELERYEVAADGRLIKRNVVRERVEDAEISLPSYRIIETSWHWFSAFNGELEIYSLVKSPVSQDWWFSVQFWIRDGVVKDAIFHKRKSGLDCQLPEAGEERT